MAAGRLLSDAEVAELLASHRDWQRDGDRLVRSYEFADFVEAFVFMGTVAGVAEDLFHHPDWQNSFNRLTVAITDHEAGGISEKDRQFVELVDRLG